MAQFYFNLHAVLRQRELVEDQRQRELAAVQSKYAAMESQLRAMDEELRAVTEDLRQNRLIGRVNLEFLAAHRRFTLSMQRKALTLAEQMAPVKAAVDAARAALVEAAKQRKIMEKLREKREAAWKVEEARKELAATDEIAQQIGVRLVRERVADSEIAQDIDASTFGRAAVSIATPPADSAGEDMT